MPYERNESRLTFMNSNLLYSEQFNNRKINHVSQYFSPNIIYPSVEDLMDIRVITHIWKVGDRFYKLSDKYYNNPNYWWILAWFNHKPLETDISLGEIINIPLPLDEMLYYFR